MKARGRLLSPDRGTAFLIRVSVEQKVLGQMVSADRLFVGQCQRHLNHAVELTQVARPGVMLE